MVLGVIEEWHGVFFFSSRRRHTRLAITPPSVRKVASPRASVAGDGGGRPRVRLPKGRGRTPGAPRPGKNFVRGKKIEKKMGLLKAPTIARCHSEPSKKTQIQILKQY